jgi:hypothetical protein
MNEFTTAIEASEIIRNLYTEARKLNYNKDIRKLIFNAETLVLKLSDAEIRARQTNKFYLTIKPRHEVAQAIDYCEKMLLILRLTQ